MDKRMTDSTKEYLVLFAVIIGVYLGFKFLSPLVTPFLFAFAFVSLLHPLLEKCQNKYHMKKGFLAAGILLLLCVTLGIGIWWLLVFLLRKVGSLSGQLDLFADKFCIFVKDCCDSIEESFGLDSDNIETLVMERVNVFIENFQLQVVPRIMDESVSYMKDIAEIVSFLAIMIIAAVLLAKDYNRIMENLRAREELNIVFDIGKKVLEHVGIFLKAQLIILVSVSLICAVTLFLGGIEGGVGIGLLTGLMDMLPFIGTGLVLMPLAFWQMLSGYHGKAILCLVLYAGCALFREFLEPKLVGEKTGIFPVFILFSVFVGIKLFGIFGIIKGPLALVTVYEVYLHLQRKKEPAEDTEGEVS